jgi:very-short-patch-repair endonuclease
MSVAEAIAACEQHASSNHGVVPREIAVTNGLADAAIHRIVSSGRWLRIQPRAYLVAGAPLTWAARLAAVQASLVDRFVFSHRTAAALLDLDGERQPKIEIVATGSPALKDVTVHRVPQLPRFVHRRGFRVTTAQRTVLDLFAVQRDDKAALALEDALRKRHTSIDRLWDEYVQTCAPGRNGCRAFRNSLLARDHRDGKLESRMEKKLRVIMRKLGGPEAVPQFPVDACGNRYRIDFAYPEIKLGLEAMSIRWHMGEARFYYDLKRDRHLKRCGWSMLYFSWDDMLHPGAIREDIDAVRSSLSPALF